MAKLCEQIDGGLCLYAKYLGTLSNSISNPTELP
jgi:hypothetical protein